MPCSRESQTLDGETFRYVDSSISYMLGEVRNDGHQKE